MKFLISGSYYDHERKYKPWYVNEDEITCKITSSHFFLEWSPKEDPYILLRVDLFNDFSTAFKSLVSKIEAYYMIKYEAPARKLANENYLKQKELE